jgi:copper(I)-binding protein
VIVPRLTTAGVVVAALAACGGDGGTEEVLVESDGIVVLDAWARPTPSGTDESAFYVTIENRDGPDDRLIGAESDRCLVVTPHLTDIVDDVASMSEAPGDRLGLASGDRVEMEPLGLHLMCLGLDDPLVTGDRPTVSLRFAEHEPIDVALTVEQR